jgi:transposase-like protein
MKVKQTVPKHLRFTLQQFAGKFPDDEACLEYLKEKRYPGGMAFCEKCQKDRKHHRVTGRPAYACDYCGKMISPMAGTIFEHSSTSLRAWFYAMYLMGSTRCGIPAKQIQREIGVTYKTAWRMFRQVRSLPSEGDLQLEGPTVEVDETYYGGVRKYGTGRPMRGDKKKTPIVAIVQRKGKVVARAVADIRGGTLLGLVRKHVNSGSTVYTDELLGLPGHSVPVGQRPHTGWAQALHHQAQRQGIRARPYSHQHRRGVLEPGEAGNRRRLPLRQPEIPAELSRRIHFQVQSALRRKPAI